MRQLIEKDFTFEIIETFDNHKVSFSVDERLAHCRIEGYLKAIILTGLKNQDGMCDDYRLVLSFIDEPEKLFYVRTSTIDTKIQLQSGNKIEVIDLLNKQITEKINSGFYDKKTPENKVTRHSNDLIIWSDSSSLEIAYHYKDGLRKLRLDSISYKPSTNALYFSCFCYMRKNTRTFKSDTFNNAIIYNDKEYSLKDFLTEILCISIPDLQKSIIEFDIKMGYRPAE